MKIDFKRLSKVLMIVGMNLLLIHTAFAGTPTPAPTEQSTDVESVQSKVDQLSNQTISVGKITKSTQEFKVGETVVPAYICKNVSYITVSDLKQAGGNIAWSPITKKTVIYDLNGPVKEELKFEAVAEKAVAYLARDTVYINYQEIPAIYVNGRPLIPTKWMTVLESTSGNTPLKIAKKDYKWYEENNMHQPMISGTNMWFDGENYIEEPYVFPELQQDQDGYYKDERFNLTPDYNYVGFVINEIDGVMNLEVELQKAWLKNPTYYTIPEEGPAELISELFPPTIVKGTMKRAAGGFAAGEQVNVQKAVDGLQYFLDGKNGGTVKVPWSSVRIQASPVHKGQATNEEIEQYINKQNLSSKTPYLVWTDLHRQRTYIFKGKQNQWRLINNLHSSSGMDITPTPRGSYTIHTRVPAFGYGKGYLAKNAYGFIGTKYLYHSVLYNSTGQYLLEGRGVLGTKASQGCIRFSPEDSVWFYKTMPPGTAVYIN